MDEIKVSILCLAYNHADYIRATLESFLMQKTDFAFEIIVNDDASTDGTANILREMAEKYPDMIVPIYHEENMYNKIVCPTHEYMLPKARGKYLAFCEGDDYWTDPDKLQMQYDFMEAHPDYSGCVHNSLSLNCKTGKESILNSRYTEDRDIRFEDVINTVGGIFHTSSVFIKSDVERNEPDFYFASNAHHVGDQPRAIWMTLSGKTRYINRIMSTYRVFSGSSSWSSRMNDHSFVRDRVTGALEMYRLILNHVSGDRERLTKECILRYEWELLQAEEKNAQLRQPPYDAVFRQKPLLQRLWIDFKICFPGLYRKYLSAKKKLSEKK